MSTIGRQVAEELHAYGDISVTDHDVEQALLAVHERVDAGEGRRSRSVVLVASAAVLAMIGVAVGAWLTFRPETATVPADDPVGPDDKLVIEYWSHPLWGRDGFVWVYEDGRVVTAEWGHAFRERRLTPSGLDLLLDRVARRYGAPTTVEVRHPCAGRQLCGEVTSVIEVNGLHYDVSDNEEMASFLFGLGSRLPHSAWRGKPMPYAPAAYQACYSYVGPVAPDESIGKSSLLEGLPVQVRDLLAAKTATRLPSSSFMCSRLTPVEASRVAGFLDLQPDMYGSEPYEFETVDGREASLNVTVTLPHGVPGLAWG